MRRAYDSSKKIRIQEKMKKIGLIVFLAPVI